jgi:hypothetical protein
MPLCVLGELFLERRVGPFAEKSCPVLAVGLRDEPTYGNVHRRDEDGRRTWRPVLRSLSPSARWLLLLLRGSAILDRDG